MPTGCIKSKSGCRGSESGIFHAVTLLVLNDHPHFGPQVEAFLQKYPFASARMIAKHFLTTASTVKKSSERNCDEKILVALGPTFLERSSKRRAC
jgi:hypothetical protein